MYPGPDPEPFDAARDAALPPASEPEWLDGDSQDPFAVQQPHDGAPMQPRGWFVHRLVRGENATLWAVRIALCAVVVGWVAVLVSVFA
jgi:hypothetical protein